MRLSAIKLAGFKSFVDPTVIPIIGQMVGVVGPNGCGKSNVIDAVRWVLGESQARQLRGASMEDVIFNGSGTRKPVSRASVELVFDNSLGKAPGQWAAYAEISVKRVLTRNGESSYHINNQHVRRRDLVDIFLGTGLGTKTSYAIIEQGMISRIIEAKPDELRGFLEEAAGISKYKERRRETETRLRDTRDNLLRLDDIRRELNEQIARLQTQAEVARHYHSLQTELKTAQQLLWLVKKRDAQTSRERYTRQIDETGLQIEAQTVQLRTSEREIEATRAAHEAASAALNDAQGEFYAATAEVSRLEQALRHQAETRTRLAAQITHLIAQRDSLTQQRRDMEASLVQWQQRMQDAGSSLEDAEMAYQEVSDALPEVTTLLHDTQARMADVQRELSLCEQSRQIDETHQQHAAKSLQQLQTRLTRLQHEAGGLPQLDHAALAHSEAELLRLNSELDRARAALDAAQYTLPALERQRQPLRQQLEDVTRRLHQVEGQLAGLRKIQSHVDSNAQLDAWLHRHQLDSLPRLWQQIHVDAGWETALEVVLREYVNAISQPETRLDALLADAPPVRVSLFDAAASALLAGTSGLPRLLDKIQLKSGQGGALYDWLVHVYVADDALAAEAARHQLADGACVVCPQGHVFTRHSVRFHAEHSAGQGVLARQREIERLALEADELSAQRDSLTEEVDALDDALR
ncbi:MAG: chromosome segregation protein SMC, partial [Pseudomonadota bacterium]